MTSESLHSTLAALREAGSVFGVLFTKGKETLFSDLAYEPERIAELTQVLDDIEQYFEQEGRAPEHLSFSYDGGNLILILRREHRLVIVHHQAEESDFILSAASAFLTDYFSDMAAESFLNSRKAASKSGGAASQKRANVGRTVDPTAPIAPATRR